jgi:phenylacetate-CoA ligase
MVKVKGVNIFPGQIDTFLKEVEGVSSEYQAMIDHFEGRDRFTLFFETERLDDERRLLEKEVARVAHARLGLTVMPKAVSIGELPRSEKKSTRVFDNRY